MSNSLLLNEFRNLFGGIPYKEISEMTGIQITRVFRIFQKKEMRANEFAIFKRLVMEKKYGKGNVLIELEEYGHVLRERALKRIEEILKKEIKLIQLKLK